VKDYEKILRETFPRVYEAAFGFCGNEEDAALIAQIAFVRAYRDLLNQPEWEDGAATA